MKKALYKSLALHLAILILYLTPLPFLWGSSRTTVSQVPIIVDLKDVKISEMTNLPPKAVFDKETKAATTAKPPKKTSKPKADTKPEPKVEPKVEKKPEPKEEPVTSSAEEAKPIKSDHLVAPKAAAKPKTAPKPPKVKPKAPVQAKPKPQKDTIKTTPAKKDEPVLANPLKDLLASVDNLEKNLGETNQPATIAEGTKVNNMGIEGGTTGSYFSELSISEIDALAGRLRACWNLDPGAKGAQNMIVELRTYLNQDGSVKDVKILDSYRYSQDPHFRSIADSARRAVYICAPYTIFSDKYQDRYNSWKTMLLRFNPLDGEIN